MQTRSRTFAEEPRGAAWRALVELLGRHAAIGGLVLRDGRSPSASAFVDELAASIVADERASSWPGTELHGGTARLVRFRLDAAVLSLLATRTDRLYGWRSPDLPEDLCAWRTDGTLLLASIAHEHDGWLELRADERTPFERVVALRD